MRRGLRSFALLTGVLLALVALAAGVYGSGGGAEVFGVTPPPPPPPSTTTSTTTTKPQLTATVTSKLTDEIVAALLADDDLLKPGSTGRAVQALETRLQDLHYDIPSPDGEYDDVTADAVQAFQKVNELDRDGVAGPATRKALAAPAKKVDALAPSGAPGSRVEVDMTRQVLYLYMNGELSRTITTSTGSGQWFVVEEEFRVSIAITNPGSFEVTRKYPDWEKGPLGSLYKPMYFDGGIAIHGYPSVPPYPASHGCVRVPIHTVEWLYPIITLGFPVYVFGKSPPAETDRPPDPTRPADTSTAGPGQATDTPPPDTSASIPTSTTEPPPETPGETETASE